MLTSTVWPVPLFLIGNGLTTPLQDGSEADDNTEFCF